MQITSMQNPRIKYLVKLRGKISANASAMA